MVYVGLSHEIGFIASIFPDEEAGAKKLRKSLEVKY